MKNVGTSSRFPQLENDFAVNYVVKDPSTSANTSISVALMVDSTVHWTDAACRKHDPEKWVRGDVTIRGKIANNEARAICRGDGELSPCPRLEQCTQWAIDSLSHTPLSSLIAGWYESTGIRSGNRFNVWVKGESWGKWSIFPRPNQERMGESNARMQGMSQRGDS